LLEHVTVEVDGETFHMLKHKDNGDCFYLDKNGCTIHDRAPSVCRQFDCRQYFLSMTRAARRAMEKAAKKHGHDQKSWVFAEGRRRLNTLMPEQRSAAMSQREDHVPGMMNYDMETRGTFVQRIRT
jgi:hypothetical protein